MLFRSLRKSEVVYLVPVSRTHRGAFRDRHERWVRDAMDALAPLTNAANADGKSLWSRSPDAGIKLAEGTRRATVAKKPGHRGERAISRKTIARGMPDVSAYLW